MEDSDSRLIYILLLMFRYAKLEMTIFQECWYPNASLFFRLGIMRAIMRRHTLMEINSISIILALLEILDAVNRKQ